MLNLSKMPSITTIFAEGFGVPHPICAKLAIEEPDPEYVHLSQKLGVNAIPL
jgi:hypothetical protein